MQKRLKNVACSTLRNDFNRISSKHKTGGLVPRSVIVLSSADHTGSSVLYLRWRNEISNDDVDDEKQPT